VLLLLQGLKSLDVVISSACASAVDNLAGFYFKNVVQGPDSGTPAAGTQVRMKRREGFQVTWPNMGYRNKGLIVARPYLLPELLLLLLLLQSTPP
jgi:hypothetical protein